MGRVSTSNSPTSSTKVSAPSVARRLRRCRAARPPPPSAGARRISAPPVPNTSVTRSTAKPTPRPVDVDQDPFGPSRGSACGGKPKRTRRSRIGHHLAAVIGDAGHGGRGVRQLGEEQRVHDLAHRGRWARRRSRRRRRSPPGSFADRDARGCTDRAANPRSSGRWLSVEIEVNEHDRSSRAAWPTPSTYSETSPPSAAGRGLDLGRLQAHHLAHLVYEQAHHFARSRPSRARCARVAPIGRSSASAGCAAGIEHGHEQAAHAAHADHVCAARAARCVIGGGLRISLMRGQLDARTARQPSANIKNSRTGPRSRCRDEPSATRFDCVSSAMARSSMRGASCRSGQHFFDDGRGVEHQTNALITELGRAREAAHARERGAERLDHDVLLAVQVVDDQAEPAAAERGHHHEAAAGCVLSASAPAPNSRPRPADAAARPHAA